MICDICQKIIVEDDEIFKLILCINNNDLFTFKEFSEWKCHSRCFNIKANMIDTEQEVERNDILFFMDK